jgi:hypothetical protein
MKLSCFLFCFCISAKLFAQNDLVLLKDKTQTLQTWTKGSYIQFQFSSKQWIEGIVKMVRNDSITIDQIQLRQVGNQFGFANTDTAHFGLLKLHVNEIYAMPKRGFSSNIVSNGALFQLGSAAYILLNITNSLIKGEAIFGAQNLTGLGIAGGFFILGKVLHSTHKTYLKMGSRFKMMTIQLGSNP